MGSKGVIAPKAEDNEDNEDSENSQVSLRRLIWMHRNNGLSSFGSEDDPRFLYNYAFEGRIYFKVEITCFEQKSQY